MRGFLTVFRKQDVLGEYSFKSTEIRKVIEHVLGKLLKLPEDEIRTDHGGAMSQFKEVIERKAPFNKILDLIEIIADIQNDQIESSGTVTRHSDEFIMSKERFIDCVKHQFDQYAAAYWLDTSQLPFQFFPRSSKERIFSARRNNTAGYQDNPQKRHGRCGNALAPSCETHQRSTVCGFD